ncbi:MAG TPA: DUF3152 domain-containing protein, partial [Cryptosporangiaceae bacterium]|nr:DUF3152 domain-containing protein [Cryptosporangiaceae bacterium]
GPRRVETDDEDSELDDGPRRVETDDEAPGDDIPPSVGDDEEPDMVQRGGELHRYGHDARRDDEYDDEYDDDHIRDLPAERRAAARRAAARRTERATATAARLSRQRRSGVVVAISVVVVVVVGYDLIRAPAADQQPTAQRVPVASASPTEPVVTGPRATSTHQAERGPTAAPPGSVPRRGAGRFTVAPGKTAVVGRGTILRYKVEVEDGAGQDAAAFAAEVDATLANPRSWTAGGQWAFQRVSYGPPDFVIQLATPDTTDKICGAGGLETRGYTSCRTGSSVVINLARWLLAVPEFQGDVSTYRLYVVNHEVGHRLGRGHQTCPGPGRLAPVMQQQTLGLRGCEANPWPYVDGKLVTGPSAP